VLLYRDPERINDLAASATRVTLIEGKTQLLDVQLTTLPPARR
jgi:hypothetical protein